MIYEPCDETKIDVNTYLYITSYLILQNLNLYSFGYNKPCTRKVETKTANCMVVLLSIYHFY